MKQTTKKQTKTIGRQSTKDHLSRVMGHYEAVKDLDWVFGFTSGEKTAGVAMAKGGLVQVVMAKGRVESSEPVSVPDAAKFMAEMFAADAHLGFELEFDPATVGKFMAQVSQEWI